MGSEERPYLGGKRVQEVGPVDTALPSRERVRVGAAPCIDRNGRRCARWVSKTRALTTGYKRSISSCHNREIRLRPGLKTHAFDMAEHIN